MLKDWQGDIVFSNSIAIFRGPVGYNKPHSHWASQITIALDVDLEYQVNESPHRSPAVYFGSKTCHQLLSGFVCSIYFDPLSQSLSEVLGSSVSQPWTPLTRDDLPPTFRSITRDSDLQPLLHSPPLLGTHNPSVPDKRLQTVIEYLKEHLQDPGRTDRDTLARLAQLSPSRFSHWFVEHTGVPLRSYKKWLKLRMAMDALLEEKMPTEAAHLAGFSDLAHMSREFSDSFGLTYLDALHAWRNSNKN